MKTFFLGGGELGSWFPVTKRAKAKDYCHTPALLLPAPLGVGVGALGVPGSALDELKEYQGQELDLKENVDIPPLPSSEACAFV